MDRPMDIIPPRTVAETHEEYMKNFVHLLVETTQQSSTFEQIDFDTKALFHKIVDGCRQPMVVAARNKHTTAQIFVYLITTSQQTSIYDLLFPTGNLKELMDKFEVKSVYQQVVDHLAPLCVDHKIYEVYKSTAIEIKNHTGDFIFDIIDDIPETPTQKSVEEQITEYVEGVKKLDPVRRYIGVITVSWSNFLQTAASTL
jgi:hypothetical protein